TFTINGINDKAGQPIMFGLEVCLDHSISTPRMRWANSTVYAIGKVVISPDDGLLYTCGIAHTSSASPTTFTQDKKNNPGRWAPYTDPWGRLRTADKWVKIQLIPSGGMELKPASIRLLPAAGATPHSFEFFFGGLATLWGDPNVQYKNLAHTQIWDGANGKDPVPRANQLINANYEQEVGTTSKRKVDDEIYEAADRTIKASDLWDLGSGYVRVMQELPL